MSIDEVVDWFELQGDNLDDPTVVYTNTYRRFLKNNKKAVMTAEDALKKGASKEDVNAILKARKELTPPGDLTDELKQLIANRYPFEYLFRVAY